MARPLMASLTIAIALLAGGCGTCANTLWFNRDEGGMRVYGGVRADLEVASEAAASPSGGDAAGAPLWLLIVDLPLSLVGDTVTLPFTIPMSLWWKFTDSPLAEEKEAAASSGSGWDASEAPLWLRVIDWPLSLMVLTVSPAINLADSVWWKFTSRPPPVAENDAAEVAPATDR